MSDDILEYVLRDALRRRVAQYDRTAAQRLLAVDYRPRRGSLIGLRPVGLVTLAAIVAACVTLLTLSRHATPALAGWTAVPTRSIARDNVVAVQRCGMGTPVLVDTRGPYVASVYAMSSGAGVCVQGGAVFFTGSGDRVGAARVGSGQIQTFASSADGSSGEAFTVLYGRVGADVSGVTIQRNRGVAVTATVSDGWYLAWWPGIAHATTAKITTRSGSQTVTLPAAAQQGPPSCGASCNGTAGYSSVSAGGGGSVGGR